MHLTLYFNASERKVIGKSLTGAGTVTGILKGDASIMMPSFILEYDQTYLTDVNYLYWAESGRYYYIDDVQVLTGERVVLHCSVDVLESFKNGIKAQTAIVEKQENRSNLYFNDGSFVKDTRAFYTVKNFPYGFNETGEFILINAGA